MLAAAVRLLERGFFRIGSEEYAVENASYGLATMRKEHVTIEDDGLMVFDFPAKSGQRRHQGDARRALARDRRRAQAAPRRRRRAARLQGRAAAGTTCARTTSTRTSRTPPAATSRRKDFRTWNATALAAVALAVSGASPATKTARKRAVNRAIEEVAHYLGNTPAVCRASYIDPRVFDAFDARPDDPPGARAGRARLEPGELAIHQPELEAAVLDLLEERASSSASSGRGLAGPAGANIRRIDGPAVMPWTTIESSTHAITVQTTRSRSPAASTPASTAVAT